MANPPATRGGNQPPQLSEETLKNLLDVQKQELVLRLKEIERDNAEINLNKSVAQQSIDAQERDRKHEREEQTKRQRTHQNFVLIAIGCALVFSAFALYVGQAGIVLDLVKVIVGFIGGMGYAAARTYRHRRDDDQGQA